MVGYYFYDIFLKPLIALYEEIRHDYFKNFYSSWKSQEGYLNILEARNSQGGKWERLDSYCVV